jgi:hypothetical protein
LRSFLLHGMHPASRRQRAKWIVSITEPCVQNILRDANN